MFGMTTGLVLYADPSKEPEPILISEADSLQTIQERVGGHIDAVRTQAVNTDNDTQMVLVGYVNDEGLLKKLPLNALASIVFNRELVGDVVLVSGTNPENGVYDGENYDLPMEFINYLIHLQPEVERSVKFSKGLSGAVAIAYRAGVISKEDIDYITEFTTDAHARGEVMGAFNEMPERFVDIVRRALEYMRDMVGGFGDE